MDTHSLSSQIAALAALLFFSGFFSMSETAMMAANRYRLRHAAKLGDRGARKTLQLLAETDRLLGVILLCNNLVNAAAATLVSVITINLFGEEKWALGAGTLVVTFLILIFAEITPKVVSARHADRLAPWFAYVLSPLLRLLDPVVWFANLFVRALLAPFGFHRNAEHSPLTREELRSLVLDPSNKFRGKHRSILANLFDLEGITVEDVMTPRGSIEAIDLDTPWETLLGQLATSHHSRLPVYRGDPSNMLGVLHLRRLIAPMHRNQLTPEVLEEVIAPPYYVPASTAAYAQLQFFEDNRQRLGFVVDEYGDILGLVTVEDLVEELVGEFTTATPGPNNRLGWDEKGQVRVEGSRSIRELNRKLGIQLPTNGPNTLNGLILEHFQDIPESGISIKIGNVPIEVLHAQDRVVKMALLSRPTPSAKG